MAGASVRGGLPVLIERGVTQTLSFVVVVDGLVTSPTSGTITITDASGVVIVNAATLTIAAGVCSYSLLATSVPATLQPGDQWQVTLALVIATLTQTVVKSASLVLRALHPAVTSDDLYSRHSDLASLLPGSRTSWDASISAAYEVIARRLIARGRRPWLLMSAWSLYDVHLNLALSFVFVDLETYTTGPGKYAELARHYAAAYETAWGALEFLYDHGLTGEVKDSTRSVSAQPSIWLT